VHKDVILRTVLDLIMPQSKTKTCQNCKAKFTIEQEDFEFYKKIDVPEPTFCPTCRAQRRLAFRTGRALYKRRVEEFDKEVFSCVSSDSPFKVYHSNYWLSDRMDATKYGVKYDFNKTFFEQIKELMHEVGLPHKFGLETVNSPYSNNVAHIKSCYLMFNTGISEDCAYGINIQYSKDCYDNSDLAKCELCYEGFMLAGCYKTFFSSNCADSQEVFFSSNCINCQNCFGCINLRHKRYYIFNKPYSKEKYFKKLEESNIGSYKNILELKEKVIEFYLKFPVKFMHGRKNVNVAGDDIYNSKNVFESYSIKDGENMKYCQLILFWPSKDSYDITVAGGELCYEIEESGGYQIKFNWFNLPRSVRTHQAGFYEMEYTIGSSDSHHLFGCAGLRHKKYCILNKQYTKKEYEELVTKIKKHMNDMPYIDKKGRIYKYGEFFPIELSPFAYNETIANEYFPLTKKQAIDQGYIWYDKPKPEYETTTKADNLPDNIKDVNNSILKEVIECSSSDCAGSGVFRIIPQELKFYKKMNLPLPRLCHDCRHRERIKQRNPIKLWERQCMNKECTNTFQTTYAPDRKEIVYCEACYNKEVG